jgi:hypothetical protein
VEREGMRGGMREGARARAGRVLVEPRLGGACII